MPLIFVNRFFYPDHSATSQMLSDVAFGLAQRGHDVHVITSRQRYEAPAQLLPPREVIEGVTVHRVWTSRFGRLNLLGRAIDYTTFYITAVWRLWRLARASDVVIAKTDPPMLSIVTAPVCRLRGAHPVNWLQDIFPETAQALGVGGRPVKAAYAILKRLRNKSLQAPATCIVLGERMAERALALGVTPDRVRTIPNWADAATISPIEPAANKLRTDWDLGDALVVGYSGNLGRAHEIDTILEAMTLLQHPNVEALPGAAGHQRVLWLFIGGGALLEPLKRAVEQRALTSVRFKPYQPSALLAHSISAADVHLVSLRPELEGLIVPSKFYGICAAGRPTIFIGDGDGEISRLIGRHVCGRTIAVGDGAGLARTVLELAADPVACGQMGDRARRAFDAEFDKTMALARWERLLKDISPATGRPAR